MAIVFGLEKLIFLAKSDIFIPKYTGGGGGLGIIPKIYNFFSASLIQCFPYDKCISFQIGHFNLGRATKFKKAGAETPLPGKRIAPFE